MRKRDVLTIPVNFATHHAGIYNVDSNLPQKAYEFLINAA
jgi:hypothetical protein